MSEQLPPRSEPNPADHPEKPDHAAVMQACTMFIIKHDLSDVYPPSSIWAPDYLDAVHFVNLPSPPPEAPLKTTPGYSSIVRDLSDKLSPKERGDIRQQSQPYRIQRQASDSTPLTPGEQWQLVLPIELARRMLIVEKEIDTVAERFSQL